MPRHLTTHSTVCAVLALCLLAVGNRSAQAWGDASHRAAFRGATAVLPDEIRPFFLANREFIARHAIDPDYIPRRTPAQAAEHFLDIDEYGQPPFDMVPHDRAEAERKFGAEAVQKRGLLPWAIAREFDRLVKALEEKNWPEVRLAAAHLSHFVADTHMPLHATKNYDGQFTGNTGIHLRFEIGLMPRYHDSPLVQADPIFALDDPVEWTFREIEESYSWCATVLRSDTEARQIAPVDTEAYYAELNRRLDTVADTRLRNAATAIGSFIAAAWEKAGKPALPPERAVALLTTRNLDQAAKDAPYGLSATTRALATGLKQLALPFDAVAVGVMDAPKDIRDVTLPFVSFGEIEQLAEARFTPLGDLKRSLPLAEHALQQFPLSARHLVLVTDSVADEAPLLEAAERLKGAQIKLWVFVVAPDAAAVARLGERLDGRVFPVERTDQLLPKLREALGPELRPVDVP